MPLAAFSPADRATLEFAPSWMLAHVGGADRKLDAKDWQALLDRVEAREHPAGLAQDVALAARERFDEQLAAARAACAVPLDGLKRVATVLDGHPDVAEAQAFRRWLLALGVEVAELPHGLLHLGSHISGDERQALREASRALHLLSRRALLSEAPSFSSILVPLDGTPESESALKPAVDLATRFGARVTLLQVSTGLTEIARIVALDGFVSPGTVEILEQAEAEEERDANAYLNAVRRIVGEPEWRVVVREGDAAAAIIEEAEAAHADVIVMATGGDSLLRRILQPSVASYVVSHCRVPVLLVHID
jgi:nucleotide-binding universal stress UspA family protein